MPWVIRIDHPGFEHFPEVYATEQEAREQVVTVLTLAGDASDETPDPEASRAVLAESIEAIRTPGVFGIPFDDGRLTLAEISEEALAELRQSGPVNVCS